MRIHVYYKLFQQKKNETGNIFASLTMLRPFMQLKKIIRLKMILVLSYFEKKKKIFAEE